MEPHRRPAGRRILLPSEQQLCESLGITVDDYFYFLTLTESYNGKRSKEYDLVPDVRNDPVTLLVVNLVVGVALSAVSYLLTPKPRQATTSGPGPSFRTPDRAGQTRFTPLYNFDSAQELAVLGSVIPLVFTLKGVRVQTQLLWSQLLSRGSSQEMRAIMLLSHGELGAKPDYEGYAIGSSNLNNYTSGKVALYCKANGGRISSTDRYSEGTLEEVSHTSDIFQVYWDKDRANRRYFSGTRTPETQTEFGCFSPIPSGMRYRIPFELTLIPKDTPQFTRDEILNKRRKIDTNFPRWIAVTSGSGSVGRTITLTIDSRNQASNSDTFGTNGDSDIKNALNDGKVAADELLSVGDQYMIGTAVTICTGASTDSPYEPGTTKTWSFEVTEAGTMNVDQVQNTNLPSERRCVMRAAIAVITNARECNVTEIGIRSTVWRQITGFPNVNAHPGSSTLLKYEQERGNFSLGNMSGYIRRISFFKLFYRAVGASSWIDINNDTYFCVIGQTPQPQYNFIRVTTPSAGQHEFRLMPIPGNHVRLTMLNKSVYQLVPGDLRYYTTQGCTVAFSGLTITLSPNRMTNPEWVVGSVQSNYTTNNPYPYDAVADHPLYDAEQSSHFDGPEHSVVYVNEQLSQEVPYYTNLAIAGIRINSSREWTNFSSLSAYVTSGIRVDRLTASGYGSTNLLPEIAYALLTDPTIGAGELIGVNAVDRSRMTIAAKFCKANDFTWDGVITERQNLRQWIFEQASYCLCDFTIIGGKFSLVPSVPYDSSYRIAATAAPTISALFTDGNIKDLKVSFLSPEERQLFRATVLWRYDTKNGFPQTRVLTVRLSSAQGGSETDPEETFDLSSFCTSYDHAFDFARYALKVRKEIDHGIKFQTTPQSAAGLSPGDYFRLVSEATHTSRFANGSIDAKGNVNSAEPLNGSYTVLYWNPGTTAIKETTITVSNGKTTNSALYGTLFTLKNTTTTNRIYKVESISYTEDGLVEIAGSYAPVTSAGGLAVLDWTSSHFVTEAA